MVSGAATANALSLLSRPQQKAEAPVNSLADWVFPASQTVASTEESGANGAADVPAVTAGKDRHLSRDSSGGRATDS